MIGDTNVGIRRAVHELNTTMGNKDVHAIMFESSEGFTVFPGIPSYIKIPVRGKGSPLSLSFSYEEKNTNLIVSVSLLEMLPDENNAI